MNMAAVTRELIAAGLSGDALCAAIGRVERAASVSTRTLDGRTDMQERCKRPSNWQEIRAYVFARDDWTCVYCGADDRDSPVDFHCDHIHPIARGGTNDLSNLATACAPCNLSKGMRTLTEWRH